MTVPADPALSAIGVPAAVVASLREELALLSDEGRLVLQGAAVAGDPFEPELAAAAAATSGALAMARVDELMRLDLIREGDVPRRFCFRHPLVRRAVYEATPAAWRLGAHERCAETLAARGVAPLARAYHVERSARQGDLAAVEVLSEAGKAVTRLAPSSAAHWFGAALRLLPETAPSEQRVEILLAQAGSLAASGHLAESHASLCQCLTISPSASRVRVATACAGVERLLGLQREAHAHLEAALVHLGEDESPEASEVMIELSIDRVLAGDFDGAHAWATRAVATAARVDDRALIGAALAIRAWAWAMAGDAEEAQVFCDEATALVDQFTDDELARRLDAAVHLATAEIYIDRYPAATRHGLRALEIGRATEQADLSSGIIAVLCGSLPVQGRPLQAEELTEGAVETARLAGNVYSVAWSLLNHGFAALVAGHLDVALASAEESCELMKDVEPGLIRACAAAVLSAALLEDGEAEKSVDLLLERAGGEELRLMGGGWRGRFLEVLTRGLLATGRRADAERAAAAAQACAESVDLPTANAFADLAMAALARDAGEPALAAQRALRAASTVEAVGALFDAARARDIAGRALVQAGDRDGGVAELERAATAFDSFGSLRYRNQAERELRKLGRHVHRRTRSGNLDVLGIESLTDRELEVARLVVDRKTNPEIAAELFLSKKTVEAHLRTIFRKMDVPSRVALAREIERADRSVGRPG